MRVDLTPSNPLDPGDPADLSSLVSCLQGVDTVFHCAASVAQFGPWPEIFAANVAATQRVVLASREAGVRSLLHVSTEAVLCGRPLVDVDETEPYHHATDGVYPRSKRLAEEFLLQQARDFPLPKLTIVRPRFIWGRPDRTILPAFVHAVRSGQLKWFGDGRYETSTCHVQNCLEGMALAEARGGHGEVYFLTDGMASEFRGFVTRMLATQGVGVEGVGEAPLWAVRAFASVSEAVHRAFPALGQPSIVPATLKIIGETVRLNDGKARAQLGYTSHVSIDAGMADLEHEYDPASAAPVGDGEAEEASLPSSSST